MSDPPIDSITGANEKRAAERIAQKNNLRKDLQ